MTVGVLKVTKDPPPNNQKTTQRHQLSDVLLEWKPEKTPPKSVSAFNGKGEIRIPGSYMPHLISGLMNWLYGEEFRKIISNTNYNGFIGSLREAKRYVDGLLTFKRVIWESNDNAEHIEFHRKEFDMTDLVKCFECSGLDRGECLGLVPHNSFGNIAPTTYISQNEKGVYISQKGFDKNNPDNGKYMQPNIVELETDEIKGVIEDLSELDDYHGLKPLVQTLEGEYSLEPFKDNIEFPPEALRIIERIKNGDFSVHLIDVSRMLHGSDDIDSGTFYR